MGKTNMIFIDPGTKVSSSYHLYSFWGWVCCLISKQDVANTNGLFQLDGAPTHAVRNTTDYLKKEKIDFIEPDMWPQTAPILSLLTMLFGGPFSRVYCERKFNTMEELNER